MRLGDTCGTSNYDVNYHDLGLQYFNASEWECCYPARTTMTQ